MLRISLILLGLLCCRASFAAESARKVLPVETFFKNHEFTQMTLSPDGTHLGALAPTGQGKALATLNLTNHAVTRASVVPGKNIYWFTWVGDRRLLFKVEEGGFETGGLYCSVQKLNDIKPPPGYTWYLASERKIGFGRSAFAAILVPTGSWSSGPSCR